MSRTPGSKKRYDVTVEAIMALVPECYGSQSIIAQKLGCSRQLIGKHAKDNPDLAAAMFEARRHAFEKIEHALIDNALSGNVIAQIFYLKTQARFFGRDFSEPKDSVHDDRDQSGLPSMAEWQAKQAKQLQLVDQMLDDFADYDGMSADDHPPELTIDGELA